MTKIVWLTTFFKMSLLVFHKEMHRCNLRKEKNTMFGHC